MGEYPWEKWQHVCLMLVRSCQLCGQTRAVARYKVCVGGYVIPLKNQPYRPTRGEVVTAGEALLGE